MRIRQSASLILTIAWATIAAALARSAEPPGGIRLTATIAPHRAAPGDTVELAVTIELPPGWTVYDIEQVPGSVLPTRLDVEPADGLGPAAAFRSEGAKESHEPHFGNRIVRYFDASPTFRRPLLVAKDARPGARKLRGRAGFLVRQSENGPFYIVNGVAFEAPFVVTANVESTAATTLPASAAEIKPIAPSASTTTDPPPSTAPLPRVHESVPPFRIVLEPSPATIHPSNPSQPFLSPWIVGMLLVIVGGALGLGLPPCESRSTPNLHENPRRLAA